MQMAATHNGQKIYLTELEGQNDFYSLYLSSIAPEKTIEEIQQDNTDGILNGNILEFKKVIKDTAEVLFQAIKYLSARRVNGKAVPANIILISLNSGEAYAYESEKYLDFIEKLYNGSASRSDSGFVEHTRGKKLCYGKSAADENELIDLLRSDKNIKVHIDDTDIVGWARTFYALNPKAAKSAFLGDETGNIKIVGEIRKPNILKDYIYPYTEPSNIRFKYLMDQLNDDLNKKDLGAFYTPEAYARKSAELVMKAISRIPEGNDYIILDRCAGTGNLEAVLSDDILKHCILSTYEYYEYKVLLQRLGSKVLRVIPPVEHPDTFDNGMVKGSNALGTDLIPTHFFKNADGSWKEGFENCGNDYIEKFVNNPKCTMIVYENPPYAETTSIEHQKIGAGTTSSSWKKNFVIEEMKKEIYGAATNDMGNAFIWSAFKYYLRQDTDSYIVYSPVKYWKTQHIIQKEFVDGYAFNRRWFHANIDACIMVALWGNKEDSTCNNIMLSGFNINDKGKLEDQIDLPVKQIYSIYSDRYYDKRYFANDVKNGITLGYDGYQAKNVKIRQIPIFNNNIIGYLTAAGSGFDNPDICSSLINAGKYNGNGFYLRSDNFLEKLPMFAASRYITYNREWTERARIMKSADGADRYNADVKSGKLSVFLDKCLFFTVFEAQNHMRSFTGSDARFYRNELCLDTTNGSTLASIEIEKMIPDAREQKMIELWKIILEEAKKSDKYDSSLTYGIYQITQELNTFTETVLANGKTQKEYDNPTLNGALKSMRTLVKDYYNMEIVPTLFEYEFLK
jgi:hypothetical protein